MRHDDFQDLDKVRLHITHGEVISLAQLGYTAIIGKTVQSTLY